MVIIVFGLPGSGKSYFASRLAEKFNALYVSSDELRMKLLPQRTYTDTEKMVVYDAMLTAMEDAIISKTPIVLDATFSRESVRTKFEQTAEKYGERIFYLEVTTPEDLARERLSTERIYSEANFAVYLKLKAQFEPLFNDHLVLVSSSTNITSMLRKATHYIHSHQ